METLGDQEKIETPTDQTEEKLEGIFKKPILIGKIGRLPKKLPPQISDISEVPSEENITSLKIQDIVSNEPVTECQPTKVPEQAPGPQVTENLVPVPYKEPVWSGLPDSDGKDYSFEVLKNGSIIDTINLMSRSFWMFGRLAGCNICTQHPTISRYHAVLQYRKEASETDGPGFYIYDLESTHGTFLNKNRLKPKVFVRIQVGHILKLGCSTRSYILEGPEYDEEEESELSVTELKQKREEEIRKRDEQAFRIQKEIEEKRRKEEERGVDWGLGEDADEETDLSENPYAQTNNEELYLDDPKKALRGFFEREGLDLEYNCSEQGIGQFLCKVELPVDDEMGRPIIAEVLHKGKKKESVIQCALEACRILDRYGVLRQATHESRKRKSKNWEENDYYDSDEDTFLDRTGTIEKKREKRMNAKATQKIETYESLVEKERSIAASITDIETKMSTLQAKIDSENNQNNDEDSLDTYMKELKDSKPDKKTIIKLKSELTTLRVEHSKVTRLINLVKPANLPPLETQEPSPSTSKEFHASSLPIFGKRKKIQFKFEQKSKYDLTANIDMDDEDEEDEENRDVEMKEYKKEEIKDGETRNQTLEAIKANPDAIKKRNINEIVSDTTEGTQEVENASSSSSSSTFSDEETISARSGFSSLKCSHSPMTFKKFETILKKGLPPYADKYQDKLEKILNNLKKLATNEDRMHVDWKMLSAKKKKVMKLISDMKHHEPNEKLEHRVSSELNRILVELNNMTEQKYKVLDKVKKMGNEIQNISEAIEKDLKDYKKEVEQKHISNKSEEFVSTPNVKELLAVNSVHKQSNEDTLSTSERLAEKEVDPYEESTDNDNSTDEKKKKKNQRRIHQRQEKQEHERQRGYEEDAARANYSMWVPPNDQLGDGRTSLNDKYGY